MLVPFKHRPSSRIYCHREPLTLVIPPRIQGSKLSLPSLPEDHLDERVTQPYPFLSQLLHQGADLSDQALPLGHDQYLTCR